MKRPFRLSRGKYVGNPQQPPWILILPGLAFFIAVVIYPAARSVVESFTDWNGINPTKHFLGFDNFRELRHDSVLRLAFWNTLKIAIVITIVQNVIGLVFALALHKRLKSRGALRALLFLPVVVNPIVIAYTWQYIYSNGGPLDTTLHHLHMDTLQRNWLGDPKIVLWAVIVPMIWQHVGYSMVIFLAGLQGVPDELIEASELDGAGRFKRFRYITWPLLAPALTIATVLTMIGGLNAFTTIFALTGGGPGDSSQTVTTLLYQEGFTYNRYGYGTAMALILSLVITVIVLVQVTLLRRREYVA